MANNLKTWKVSLPEDSPVLTDLLEYGREMGMQPAEVTRVILTEWSRAMRGRNPFAATIVPSVVNAKPGPAPAQTPEPKEKVSKVVAKFGKATAGFDDDDDE